MAQITFKDAIAILIADDPNRKQHIYHADERAVWELKRLHVTNLSTCGFAIACQVVSCVGHGISCNTDRALEYAENEDLLFSPEDKFFDSEEEAYSERAQILSDLILGADWKNES